MAKVLGETGRYVSEQSTKKFLRIFLLLYLFGIALGFAVGYMIGAKQNYITLLFILVLPLAWKYLSKKIKDIESDRLSFRKGATGEAIVGFALDNFPDEFRVIHDLTTPYGNVDHVVIGPTGAYIIDSKNWRGVVAADGNGELLLNGKPTQKTEVKNLSRRIMSIKEKLNVLSSLDPYVQGVFAFPSAYIEAKWGTTGYVHCVKDEQLYDYIVENKKSKKLSQKEIESISQAFLALARMDKDFGQNNK
jgi:hypothetical protein